MRRWGVKRFLILSLALVAVTAPMGAVKATHSDETTSAAIYRIPYQDGTLVDVSGDAHNHGGTNGNRDRIDMRAVDAMGNQISPASGPAVMGDGTALIVATASGTIARIVDVHGNDYGRGDGVAADGSTPQNDALEHSCQDATEDLDGDGILDPGEDLDGDGNLDTSIPNSVVNGLCQSHNNYVWIAHPNGEWTKYSHFRTGTVTIDQLWAVGDSVEVGDVLGEEGDVGRASGTHLHYEVANLGSYDTYDTDGDGIPETLPPNIGNPGGFISDTTLNHNPQVCNATNANFEYVDDNDSTTTLTAGDCVNTAPVADAGGNYTVDEGSTVMLDGTASSDIHNALLTYSWSPATNLDDPTSATPVYSGVDDTVDVLTLTVDDEGGDVSAAEALTDSDDATVTVENVAPTVSATGDSIDEGGTATVTATVSDPGTLDTHTATIDWDDGTAPQPVTKAALESGVQHVYGDNGQFDVVVTVTDDDGGVGADEVTVTVGNLDPSVMLDTSGAISFPGGDYLVVNAGAELPGAAEGSDPGSDDLTFTWSVGDVNTYFNDGVGPDPLPSPGGTFPFETTDAIDAVYAGPGVSSLSVMLTDDDFGSDEASVDVIVTGNADDTQGSGWWKHQYSGKGKSQLDETTASAYRDIVNAVSSVFSESVVAATASDVHTILSPNGGDRRARATAALMVAWLQFASGAVAWDAIVPTGGGASVGFLDLMSSAEATILDGTATNKQLIEVEQDLAKVRQAP